MDIIHVMVSSALFIRILPSLARSQGSDLARLTSKFRQIWPDFARFNKSPKNRVLNDVKIIFFGQKIYKNVKKSRSYSKKMHFFFSVANFARKSPDLKNRQKWFKIAGGGQISPVLIKSGDKNRHLATLWRMATRSKGDVNIKFPSTLYSCKEH